MIKIWKYNDAPEQYRELSSGHYADWIAFIPSEMVLDDIPWMEPYSSFGRISVEQFTVMGGCVRIGHN